MKILIPPADLDVVGLGSVRHNVPVEVPDQIAGIPPDPRREEAMLELNEAIAQINHEAAQKLRDEIALLEMGVGLLAQGWREATAEEIAAAAEEAEPSAPPVGASSDGDGNPPPNETPAQRRKREAAEKEAQS